jgi:hypothetical protein
VYRLAGLKPGRYLIRTAAKSLADGVGLLPTYHGQSAEVRQARSVQVRLDEEVTGIDLTPQPGRLASISGVVPPGVERLTLVTETGPREARIGPAGRFQFDQLAPGTYEFLANPSSGSPRSGYAQVSLGSEDATVTVDVGPSPTMAIRCLTADGAVADSRSLSIFSRRRDMEEPTERIACGEKKLWGPGRWELGVIPPPQYYVSSILDASSGGQTHDFLLRPREAKEITVLLGSRPASLRGTALTSDGVPAPGAPVFLNGITSDLQRRVGGVRRPRPIRMESIASSGFRRATMKCSVRSK